MAALSPIRVALSSSSRRAPAVLVRSRFMSTEAAPASVPSSSAVPDIPTKLPDESTSRVGQEIFVRVWDGIPSAAHALAIVKHLELNYGEVADFFFPRNIDTNEVQSYGFITFRDASSVNKIGTSPTFVDVPAPAVNPRQPGGLSWNDVKDVFNWRTVPRAKEIAERSDARKAVMEVKVEVKSNVSSEPRSASQPLRLSDRNLTQRVRALQAFSGFNDGLVPVREKVESVLRSRGVTVPEFNPTLNTPPSRVDVEAVREGAAALKGVVWQQGEESLPTARLNWSVPPPTTSTSSSPASDLPEPEPLPASEEAPAESLAVNAPPKRRSRAYLAGLAAASKSDADAAAPKPDSSGADSSAQELGQEPQVGGAAEETEKKESGTTGGWWGPWKS